MKILIINGPNLNLIGSREPDVYGTKTLEDINRLIENHAKQRGVEVSFLQTNHEGDIIDAVQKAGFGEKQERFDAIVINPGAFTHYSIAIRDAVKAAGIPVVEVHLSNIHGREEFRARSVVAGVCIGQITGFGYRSYLLAIDVLVKNES
jgi:3-dehydroquinate dehydratase-2